MAFITYMIILGIIVVLTLQIKGYIQHRFFFKQDFKHHLCAGEDYVLIDSETIYHHSPGKKIAIQMDDLRKIRISQKLIYLATDKISTVFCPKFGIDEIADEILQYTSKKASIDIERGVTINSTPPLPSKSIL